MGDSLLRRTCRSLTGLGLLAILQVGGSPALSAQTQPDHPAVSPPRTMVPDGAGGLVPAVPSGNDFELPGKLIIPGAVGQTIEMEIPKFEPLPVTPAPLNVAPSLVIKPEIYDDRHAVTPAPNDSPQYQTLFHANREAREAVARVTDPAIDFLAEAKERLAHVEDDLLHAYDAQARLVDIAFSAEGAAREFRQIPHRWTGSGVDDLSELARQFQPIRLYDPDSPFPRGPCPGAWKLVYPDTTNGIEGCYFHEPTPYLHRNFETIDMTRPVIRSEHDIGPRTLTMRYDAELFGQIYAETGDIHGALPGRLSRMPSFYQVHIRHLERLIGDLGDGARLHPDAAPNLDWGRSVAISGFEYLDPNTGETRKALRGARDQRGFWGISEGMRQALVEIEAYVRDGHRRWLEYEAILSQDYPRLVARAFARRAARFQDYGELQDPIYDEIMALYGDLTEKNLQKTYGKSVPDQVGPPLARKFTADHQALFDRLDKPYACAWKLDGSLARLDLDFETPILGDPIAVAVEMIDGLQTGIEVRPAGGDTVYRPGDRASARIAGPPTSIANLPAYGGLALRDCEVVRLDGNEGEAVQVATVASDDPERQQRYSATDEALP